MISFKKIVKIYKIRYHNWPKDLKKAVRNVDFEKYLIEKCKCIPVRKNEEYIYFKNCPICGHNNCFVLRRKRNYVKCFGKNGNCYGNMIFFLMYTQELTEENAIEYFKHNFNFKEKQINSTGLEVISATELIQKNIKKPFSSVHGLIFQGITIIAARPKYRKSWLILLMCLMISSGQNFLGFKTVKCGVLYVDLEDSLNRLQHRIKKILDGDKIPESFDITIHASTLETGFIQELEEYIKQKPETKLIAIDTLQKIRGNTYNKNLYSQDYSDLSKLKSFADKYGVCIVVVHHIRKSSKNDNDVFEQILGTNGITGAVDTILVLNNFDKDLSQATLHITGRDVESDELTLQFNNDNCRWSCLGNAEIQAQKREQKEYEENPLVVGIKRLIKDSGEWQGEATQLKELLLKQNVDFDYNPAVMAKKLKKLTEKFMKYDNIIYTAPPENGSNGHRIHKFKKASFEINVAGEIDDIDLFT